MKRTTAKRQSKASKSSKQFNIQNKLVKFGIPIVVVLAFALVGVKYIANSHADSDSIHCTGGVCGPGETEDRNGQFMVGMGKNKWIRVFGGSPPAITQWLWYYNGKDSYGQDLWQIQADNNGLCLEDSNSYIIEHVCTDQSNQLFEHQGDRIANLAANRSYGCKLCGELYATGGGGDPVRVKNINSGTPDTNFDAWFLL